MNETCVLEFPEMTDEGSQDSQCARAPSPDENVTKY